MERRWAGVAGLRGAVRDAVTPKLAQRKRKWGRSRRSETPVLARLLGRQCLLLAWGRSRWRAAAGVYCCLLTRARVGCCSRLKLVPGGAGGQRIGCGAGWGRCDGDEPRARYVRDLLDASPGSRGHATEAGGLGRGPGWQRCWVGAGCWELGAFSRDVLRWADLGEAGSDSAVFFNGNALIEAEIAQRSTPPLLKLDQTTAQRAGLPLKSLSHLPSRRRKAGRDRRCAALSLDGSPAQR